MNRLYRGKPEIVPNLPEEVLKKLISLCVCDNTFVFNGKVYSQIDGVAMGSSLGPVLANIWMCHLEEEYIFSNGNVTLPSFYRRYVDDTFCLFKSYEEISSFHIFLNSIHNSTKFDLELELDGKLSFLDTVVSRDPLSVSPTVSTKVKATDKGLFYDYASFIPDRYKSNLVCCLVYRVYKIASNYHVFDRDLKTLCTKLFKNGFPKDFVESCISRVLDGFYEPKVPVLSVSRKEVLMVMPYLGFMSMSLKRDILKLVRKFYPTVDIKLVFKRGTRISNLFRFKDTFPLKCKSGVVYYIECCKCGQSAAYIGKTKNTLFERFYGSNGHLNPKTQKSALIDHVMGSGDPECSFDFDSIKLLDSASADYRLRIIESVYLKFDKQSLNTQEYSYPLKLF